MHFSGLIMTRKRGMPGTGMGKYYRLSQYSCNISSQFTVSKGALNTMVLLA